jgi:hypothetical protein
MTTHRTGGDVDTALAPSTPLTALDRCDRCGAQAYVRVTLGSGMDLLFCGHHFAEFKPGLQPLAAHVQDETDKLASTPTAPLDER